MLCPVPIEIVCEATVSRDEARRSSIVQKLATLNTGMTPEELMELARFIDLLCQSKQPPMMHYLRKEDTKAPRTVEFDAAQNRIFIHLKTHNMPPVGKGYHKQVTHSILYDPLNPKLVATAVASDSATTRAEIAVLEKFRGSEGIIEPLLISKHKKKSGKTLVQIITPLYNKGSLNNFLKKTQRPIPLQVKLKIAKDILTGSCKINAMGYVNRDNNKGNFFVHHENGVYSAVIGDLGGYTEEASVALQKRPFGPGFRSAPPDLHRAYYEKRLTEQDLYSHHVYALGRVFYFLLFEQEVPWIEEFDDTYRHIANLYKDPSNPDVVIELDHFTNKVVSNTKPRLQELSDKLEKQSLEPHEKFEFIIMHMLSADPTLRKTNAHWLPQLTALEAASRGNACPAPKQQG